MKKINLLIYTLAALPPLSQAMAQSCTTPPSCDTLGYKQAASDCTGQQMLKCPFDNSKVFCGGTACSEDYSLSSCNTSIGYCASCGGKYKYTSCKNGWYLDGIQCRSNSCNGYYACNSNIGNCSTSDYCMSGSTKLYKYTSCKTSWILKNGYCEEDWNSCGLNSTEYCLYDSEYLSHRGSTSSCVIGGKTYLYNTSCFDGTSPRRGLCGSFGISCF